jgi:hypothetical protein
LRRSLEASTSFPSPSTAKLNENATAEAAICSEQKSDTAENAQNLGRKKKLDRYGQLRFRRPRLAWLALLFWGTWWKSLDPEEKRMRTVALTLSFFALGVAETPEFFGSLARATRPFTTGLNSVPQPLATYVVDMHRSLAALNATQDCMAYALAYEYALRAQPARAPNLDVFNALRLGPNCGVPPPPALDAARSFWPPFTVINAGVPTFYVSPTGNDADPGTEAAPFRTVLRGVNATRGARAPGTGPAAIVLRAGIHLLGDTVSLDDRDDGLAISNYPGEAAWVSGAAVLSSLDWKPFDVVPGGANVYAARVAAPPPFMVSLLTADDTGAPNKRLYRAQFPNFNPEWSVTGACGGGGRAFEREECARDAAASPLIAALGARYAAGGGDARAAWGPGLSSMESGLEFSVNDPVILE